MLQRIRAAFGSDQPFQFNGPVEVDESYFGGLEKNKHVHKKANLGRGAVDKTVVVGMKDRKSNQVTAKVIQSTDGATLNAFVDHHTSEDAKVYTDGSCAYRSRQNHEYGQTQCRGVCERTGTHKWRRELLGRLKEGLPRCLPPYQPQAPTALRRSVRRKAQHPRVRYCRPDGVCCTADGWKTLAV